MTTDGYIRTAFVLGFDETDLYEVCDCMKTERYTTTGFNVRTAIR